MRQGSLDSGGLSEVLVALGATGETGCLRVTDVRGDTGLVHLRDGRVYSVLAPGLRPRLGARLVASGQLAAADLEDALAAQRTELQGWRLSELVVHLGYVDAAVVESFVLEQLREAAGELLAWTGGRWRFRSGELTRDDVCAPVDVAVLVEDHQRNQDAWASLGDAVPGPGAVLTLAAGGLDPGELVLDPAAWALLCAVDSRRSIIQLARECGITVLEAGQATSVLVEAGLVQAAPDPQQDDRVEAADAQPDDVAVSLPTPAAEGAGEGDDRDHVDHVDLVDLVDHVDLVDPADPVDPPLLVEDGVEQLAPDAGRERWALPSEETLDQVSRALSSLLGAERLEVGGAAAEPASALIRPVEQAPDAGHDDQDPDAARRARIRAAAGEELAATHEAAWAFRRDQPGAVADPGAPAEPGEPVADSFDYFGTGEAPASAPEPSAGSTAAAVTGPTGVPDGPVEDPGTDGAADTAAMLRELASLGVADRPVTTPTTAPAPRAPAERPRRRKGLFGRS